MPVIRPGQLVAAAVVALVVAGCVLLSNPPGADIVVQNEANDGYVIEVVDPYGRRYYAIAPNSLVLIDTVADANPPPDSVTVLDGECLVVDAVSGEFAGGGVISLRANQPPMFTPGRPAENHPDRPADQDTGQQSCLAAAGAL